MGGTGEAEAAAEVMAAYVRGIEGRPRNSPRPVGRVSAVGKTGPSLAAMRPSQRSLGERRLYEDRTCGMRGPQVKSSRELPK
jgi:hypothetical protein